MRIGKILRAAGACIALAAGVAAAGVVGPSVRAATRTLTDVTTAVTETTVTISDPSSTPAPDPPPQSTVPELPPSRARPPERTSAQAPPKADPTPAAPVATKNTMPSKHPQKRNEPVFLFRVEQGGPVEVSLRQVAPTCRVVWTFAIEAHAGANRIALRSAPDGEPLATGVYSVAARIGDVRVAHKRVVIGEPRQAAAACAKPNRSRAQPQRKPATRPAAAAARRPPLRHAAVLAAHHERLTVGVGHGGESRTALMIILAAATFLLGIAALPGDLIPNGGAGTFVRRRRGPVAAAGIAALAAFLVSYFLT